MSDERPGDVSPITDADTTPPNPSPQQEPSASGGWQMPEPKFQQTSGYLPQGYLEQLGIGEAEKQAATSAAAVPASAPPDSPMSPPVAVEAQPDLTEQIEEVAVPAASAPVVKKRSKAARILFIVLGILVMFAFIAIFLTVIYILFLSPNGGNGQF